MESEQWTREFFATETGKETARRLAAVHQALSDAWPYMDSGRWMTAVTAVQEEMVSLRLPPAMTPNAVDGVIDRIVSPPTYPPMQATHEFK